MQSRGEIIRRARVQKRMSQERLGELLGVSRSAVNQWEADITEPESMDRLSQIAELLDLDVALLIQAPGKSGRRNAAPVRNGTTQNGHGLSALIVWKSVPARGSQYGGFVLLPEKDGEVPRPKFLEYKEKSFAFRVLDEANWPVYKPRDVLLVDPETPAMASDDCLFTDGMDAKEGSEAIVGNLVRVTPAMWIVKQYGEPDEIELPKSEFPHAWPLVGRWMIKSL